MTNRDGNRRRLRWVQLITSVLALMLILVVRIVEADEPTWLFNIPEQDLASAVVEFNNQTGIQTLFGYGDAEDIDRIHSPGVIGVFTLREALTLLLDGTGFEFQFTSPNKIAVTPAAANQPGMESAVTRSTRIALEAQAALHPIDEVNVTGTRIRGALDVVSPTVLMPRKELRRTTYATVQDALYTLPLNSLSGPREDLGTYGNAGYGAGVNLRHLGPGATLVLVNGQRQPMSGENGAFTDVSNIPLSAVERIEIVPDGSSALYGSDAVAGVVNVIMRNELDGAETQVRLTGVPGGANEIQASQQVGGRWNSGNAYVAYQYAERAPLDAADRAYAANGDKRSRGGTDHRSYFASPGNLLDPLTLEPILGIPSSGASTASDYSPNINLASRYEQAQLLPERQAHNIFATVSQALGDSWSMTANGRYGVRSTSKNSFSAQQLLVVPSTHPYYVNPFPDRPPQNILVAYSFMRDLGPATYVSSTRVTMGAVTATKSLGDDWSLALTQTYGQEELKSSVINTISSAALSTALNARDPVQAFNPFGLTELHVLNGIRRTFHESARSKIATSSIVADGRVGHLRAGYMKAAIGAEYRRETFGYIRFWGAAAESQRQVSSAFAELAVPLIGNPVDTALTPRLEFTAAGRFEKYDDFGDTFNPRLGVRWAPTGTLKVRGSWGRSFRAPTLVDRVETGNVSGITSLPDPAAPSGTSLVLYVHGNNPALREETAQTWTAGVDFVPLSLPGLSASLTYYDVSYADQIVTPGDDDPFQILLHEDKWAGVIDRHPSRHKIDTVCQRPDFVGPVSCQMAQPTVFIDLQRMNLAQTTMKGIEADVGLNWNSKIGGVGVRLMGSYILEYGQRSSPVARTADLLDTTLNPLSLKLRASAEWNQRRRGTSGFSAAAAVNFVRGYRDTGGLGSRSVRPWTTADLQLSYRTYAADGWLANTEWVLNAINILDSKPPFVDREEGYDVANAQPIGGTYSFEFTKNW